MVQPGHFSRTARLAALALRAVVLTAAFAPTALALTAPASPVGGLQARMETPALNALAGLDLRRDVRIYLPASYAGNLRRYAVLYVAGEQAAASGQLSRDFAERMAGQGVDVIVVSVASRDDADPQRVVSELAHIVKPYVDAHYRTLTGARHTGIVGAGTEALLSLQAGLTHPNTFGYVGAVNPTPFDHHALMTTAWRTPLRGQGYYLSAAPAAGQTAREGGDHVFAVSQLAEVMRAQGARVGFVEVAGNLTPPELSARLGAVVRNFYMYASNQ